MFIGTATADVLGRTVKQKDFRFEIIHSEPDWWGQTIQLQRNGSMRFGDQSVSGKTTDKH